MSTLARRPDAVAEEEAGQQTLLGGGIPAGVVAELFKRHWELPGLLSAVADLKKKVDASRESNLGGEIMLSRNDRFEIREIQ